MNRLDKKYLIIGKNARIASRVLFLLPERIQDNNRIVIGNDAIIRDGSIIYGGAVIGDNVTIDHYCIIRESVHIGHKTRILNFTEINRDVQIGISCRIGGFLANRVYIGDNTSSFGYLVHKYPNHGSGIYEATPHIGDNVIVGQSAIIAGDIKIPSGNKIKAGQLVTERNIDNYINTETNKKDSNE